MKKYGKKTLSLILAMLMVVSVLPLTALSSFAATSGNWEYSVSNNEATITKYKGTATDVTIPSEIDGYSVTSIGYMAFYGCTPLESITIPDSVTSIGDTAFSNCNSLTSITIPDSVLSIGIGAFSVCTSLTSITIPKSIISISKGTFSYCTSLTSVTIPDSVISIGDGAFSDCTSLISITIPERVASIGIYTFYKCTSLTDINVDSDNQSYCSVNGVLFNKDKSELIQYPTGKIDNVYSVPNSVTSIGWRSFEDCVSLTSITIPDSVTSISGYAFSGCTSLTNITIPDGVTSISDHAFYGCNSLTSITIPDSVTSIGDSAFHGCTSLTNVTIPNSVTSIGDYAFAHCYSFTNIIIPNSITDLGSAFICCNSLKSVILGNGLTRIEDETFVNCRSLISINIPDNVASIGGRAFYGCTSLTDIIIPKSVSSIETRAFGYNYDYDKEVKILGLEIKGYKGSTAEKYAKENEIKFVYLDGEETEPIDFPDIKSGAWYYDAAQYCAQKGYISGYQNGKFGPSDNLKRQDFVVILSKIAGADLDKYAKMTPKLKDVKKGAYYAAAVNWAVDNNIIAGYANGNFGVNDNITREQVATILYRYMKSPEVKNVDSTLKKFSDVNRISSFAKTAVAWAVQNNVISGMADGRVAPTEGASRAQIASIIMRMDQQGMFNK